ncbi:MAG TPA: N-acetylmuramoyl-L-alanine amidase [Candidatus Acidoferrum sp.]|jgi:N-acetylmuramoyl-L-alanine amidase
MLLNVTNRDEQSSHYARFAMNKFVVLSVALFLSFGLAIAIFAQVPGQNPSSNNPPATPSPNAAYSSSSPAPQTRPGLNIVVLDPAHGGTDTGARGTGGIRESEIVMDFVQQVRRKLELQGFQVLQTRQANENPSFDDRSALANAQTGAVFVSLHISSAGLPGTVRVYVNSDLPAPRGVRDANGLLPWDRAQVPFLGLSHKLGDTVQGNLAQQFRGSPATAQVCAIRQLRTTAAPAIAVEISSVSVKDRAELDRMIPGVADSIARGISIFRPSYVIAASAGALR